jgi:hypothetical protein
MSPQQQQQPYPHNDNPFTVLSYYWQRIDTTGRYESIFEKEKQQTFNR